MNQPTHPTEMDGLFYNWDYTLKLTVYELAISQRLAIRREILCKIQMINLNI